MASHGTGGPTGFIDTIEETLIAALLGAMTLVTFANVLARFFDIWGGNVLWALEATVFMFGWLVLLGASYAVKKNAHLGVDALVNIMPPAGRKVMGLVAVSACLVFSLLLLKGCYDYWAVFADLPPTSGRWFPTGFNFDARSQSFYEVDDVPMLPFLTFLEGAINYGDEYEKLPKVVPYLVLPLSAALLLLRFTQAAFRILNGTQDRLVASHELDEDDIEDAANRADEEKV
ncbi:TRAP transporter small permease [Nereida sp. MMG025]|uniref:TRAP transporter small permease n=1 Tax=Nereida sp. MMG025 TaxID=2909981 RepID=UPI001F358123|nr:TRAP transporter small permease [Nereida sp. MMG025]MCF6445373.1 TRAP transporter small permease [Nereida sp. MMG025]